MVRFITSMIRTLRRLSVNANAVIIKSESDLTETLTFDESWEQAGIVYYPTTSDFIDPVLLMYPMEMMAWLRIKGEYEIWKDGVLIDRFHNIICVPVYEYILKSLAGEALGSLDVSYLLSAQEQPPLREVIPLLETEGFRKEFTSKSWTGKQFVAICQLATDEANFTIHQELAFLRGGSVDLLILVTFSCHIFAPFREE